METPPLEQLSARVLELEALLRERDDEIARLRARLRLQAERPRFGFDYGITPRRSAVDRFSPLGSGPIVRILRHLRLEDVPKARLVCRRVRDVELGDQPAVECGPGTIIEIPPKVMHFVVSKGETPLKVLVLYSPPLPPRDDTPVD